MKEFTISEVIIFADTLYDVLKQTIGQYFFIDRNTFHSMVVRILTMMIEDEKPTD